MLADHFVDLSLWNNVNAQCCHRSTVAAVFLSIEGRLRLEIANHNPWELLVLAFYFLLTGICVLWTKYSVVVTTSLLIRREIVAVAIFHFLGWLALGYAAFLIGLYFRLRRSS